MKKSTKIILVASLCCICSGIVLSIIAGFAGASLREVLKNDLWSYTVSYDDSYNSDFAENCTYEIKDKSISSISIDWIHSDVTVEAYDGDAIILQETSKDPITEENCLRYKVEDGELDIVFSKGTFQVGIDLSDNDLTENLHKALTIKVPKDLAASLSELSFDSTSSDIFLKGLNIGYFDGDTVSGDITGTNLQIADFDVSTTSGELELSFDACPDDFTFDSVSGDATVFLPEDSGLYVSFDSVSGDFKSEFKTHHHEDDYGEYHIGDGQREFDISTTSGNFIIKKTHKN